MNLHRVGNQSEIQIIADFMTSRHPGYYWEPSPTTEGALRYAMVTSVSGRTPDDIPWLLFNRYDTQGQRQRALAWNRTGRPERQ